MLDILYGSRTTDIYMINYEEEFSSDGRRISVIYYKKLIGKRILIKKNAFEYTSEGDLSTKISYIRDNKNKVWILSKKTDYTYDEEGNMKSVAFLRWSNNKKNWELESQQKMSDFTHLPKSENI